MSYSRGPREDYPFQFDPAWVQHGQPFPVRLSQAQSLHDDAPPARLQPGQFHYGQSQYAQFQQVHIQPPQQPVLGNAYSEHDPIRLHPGGLQRPKPSVAGAQGHYYYDDTHMYRQDPSFGAHTPNASGVNGAGRSGQAQDVSWVAPGPGHHPNANGFSENHYIAGQHIRQTDSRQDLLTPIQASSSPFAQDTVSYNFSDSGQRQNMSQPDFASSLAPSVIGSNDFGHNSHHRHSMTTADHAGGSAYGNGPRGQGRDVEHSSADSPVQMPAPRRHCHQLGYPAPQDHSANNQEFSSEELRESDDEDDEEEEYDADDPKPTYIGALSSAFLMYRTDRCRSIGGANSRTLNEDINKITSTEWKNMPPEEKAYWHDKRAKLGEEYKRRGWKKGKEAKAFYERELEAWNERRRRKQKEQGRVTKSVAPQKKSRQSAQPAHNPPMTRPVRRSTDGDRLTTLRSPTRSYHSSLGPFEQSTDSQMLHPPLSSQHQRAGGYVHGYNKQLVQFQSTPVTQGITNGQLNNGQLDNGQLNRGQLNNKQYDTQQMAQQPQFSSVDAALSSGLGSARTGNSSGAASNDAQLDNNRDTNRLLAEIAEGTQGVADWRKDPDVARLETTGSDEYYGWDIADPASRQHHSNARGAGVNLPTALIQGTDIVDHELHVSNQHYYTAMGSNENQYEARARHAAESQDPILGRDDQKGETLPTGSVGMRGAASYVTGVSSNPSQTQSQGVVMQDRTPHVSYIPPFLPIREPVANEENWEEEWEEYWKEIESSYTDS
ncbi:hypothetical protein F5Y18DRAFT_428047 [Xylariaceae sp. FL1019]|nr:hypothetical protein F5Y18DRAFT_428047 [Xylariaceae sp. FL1019]